MAASTASFDPADDPNVLTTLAMMGIAKGVAMWISDTAAIPILNNAYSGFFGGSNLGPVPSLLIWMVLAGVVGHIVLRKTRFGRQVLAVGGNAVAARYSGIRTSQVKFFVIVLSSVAAALAGMLYAGRLQSGRFQLGEGDELSVIAAAVLGGTSLFGGKGTVIGTIIGALMIGVINNGLILMGLEYSQQLIARGGSSCRRHQPGRRQDAEAMNPCVPVSRRHVGRRKPQHEVDGGLPRIGATDQSKCDLDAGRAGQEAGVVTAPRALVYIDETPPTARHRASALQGGPRWLTPPDTLLDLAT